MVVGKEWGWGWERGFEDIRIEKRRSQESSRAVRHWHLHLGQEAKQAEEGNSNESR